MRQLKIDNWRDARKPARGARYAEPEVIQYPAETEQGVALSKLYAKPCSRTDSSCFI